MLGSRRGRDIQVDARSTVSRSGKPPCLTWAACFLQSHLRVLSGSSADLQNQWWYSTRCNQGQQGNGTLCYISSLKIHCKPKKKMVALFFLHCGLVYGYDSIWTCKHNYVIIYLFCAWPALTSSQLSLLLLANTFDSAAEFRLHNPDCQTLRVKKKLLSKSDVLCNIFRLLFVVCS